MAEYRVNWNYRSGIASLEAGKVIDLRPDVAETINRDSPGVLTLAVLAVAPKPERAPDDVAGHFADHRRDISAPPATRQITAPAAKRGPGRPPKNASA